MRDKIQSLTRVSQVLLGTIGRVAGRSVRLRGLREKGERGFLGCRDGGTQEPVVPGKSTLRAGLPNAYRTRHPALGTSSCPASSFSSLPPPPPPFPPRSPPPPLSSLSRSFSRHVYETVSIGHLLAPCSRSLSSFWRGPHFFWLRLRWVAPRPVYARPMRSATAVTPLPECSDSGGLPHRLLIGVVPLSLPHGPSPVARSCSPFSLTVQPFGCPPPSASRVYVSALALLSSSVS